MLGWLMAAALAAGPPPLRFGLTADYPPFASHGAGGVLVGADVAAARRVARALARPVAFVPSDWRSVEADFAAGRFDILIGGITVTPERAGLGTYSIPLMTDGKRPLARCGEAKAYRTIAAIDRPGVRVQINRGPEIGRRAKAWFSRAAVTVNADDADLVPALLERRADVWVTDGVVVDHMARRWRGRLCATTTRPFTQLTKAWLIRRDPALVARVNASLKRQLADGSWRRALRAVP